MKKCLLLIILCCPLFVFAQQGDTTQIKVELKTEPMQLKENTLNNHLVLPDIKQPKLLLPPEFWEYDIDPFTRSVTLTRPVPKKFEFNKSDLRLNFAPKKSFREMGIGTKLLYATGFVLKQMNHTVQGVDKELKINLDMEILNRSRIPETAKGAQGQVNTSGK